jgi:Tol biopolymer transport system component
MLKFYLIILLCFNITSQTFAVVKQVSQPWLRLNQGMSHLKTDPNGHYLAFLDPLDRHLFIIDLRSKEIHAVSPSPSVGLSFFWSPQGSYLFFSEQKKVTPGVESSFFVYNTSNQEIKTIKTLKGRTSYMNFDPMAQKFYFFDENGNLHAHSLEFVNMSKRQQTMHKFAKGSNSTEGTWIVANKKIYWMPDPQLPLKQIEVDNQSVENFHVSNDGQSIAWNTEDGRLFVSEQGQKPTLIDQGRYPQWHPQKKLLLYSGARLIGKKTHSYDLKILDVDHKESRWLTNTPHTDESNPQWLSYTNKILYTANQGTDIFVMAFKEK